MYKIETKVRYSECGADGKIRLASIINYFQDSSSAHSESLGVGMDYLAQKKKAWILNSWQVIVERYPKVHEEIVITTWATGFKGVFGPRNFCMKTKEGEMLAYANTLWVYMDVEKGMPTKPNEEEKAIYGVEPPLEMEYAPRKIAVSKESNVVDILSVHKYHIDTNQHMNNSQYVQIAAEVLPENFKVREVRVEYKKSAVFGDKLILKRAIENLDDKKSRIVVELCDENDVIYALTEFFEY